MWAFWVNGEGYADLLVQCLYCLCAYLLTRSFSERSYENVPCFGLWPLVVVDAFHLYAASIKHKVKPLGLCEMWAVLVLMVVLAIGVWAAHYWYLPLGIAVFVGFLRNVAIQGVASC